MMLPVYLNDVEENRSSSPHGDFRGFCCVAIHEFLWLMRWWAQEKWSWELRILGSWLGLCAFTVEDLGSIPGWGTKIPQAMWPGPKKINDPKWCLLGPFSSLCLCNSILTREVTQLFYASILTPARWIWGCCIADTRGDVCGWWWDWCFKLLREKHTERDKWLLR